MQPSTLAQFLNAPRASAAEQDALRAVIDEVTPVIEGVIRGRVAASVGAIEREELFSEVILQLIRRLQALKSAPSPDPIANLSGYAAVTAFHAVHAHIRRAHPERRRLRNRIRNVLRTSASFALWPLPSGQFVCGRAMWTNREECSAAELDRVPTLPSIDDIARALEHVFDHVQKPVELERLVELFHAQVTPTPAVQQDAIEPIESSLVQRSALAELWREIDLLPARQRISLLLGLRDDANLLLTLGIVTFDELAAAVAMRPSELAAMWDHLPLPDLAIAERLHVSRQQVINLRKSARERLGRRILAPRLSA